MLIKHKTIKHDNTTNNIIPELSNVFNVENENFNSWCMDKYFYKYYIKKYYLAMSTEMPDNFFNLDYDFFKKYNEYKKIIENYE